MSNCVAQEIRWLLADESDRRPSATRRLARARLAASMAEGLDRARIADLRAGLTDGARAAFLDARLSAAERQIVVTALSHDPAERAEIGSAADLLDCVGTDPIPLPQGLVAKAAAALAATNSAAGHDVAVHRRGNRRRQALLIAGVGLAAAVLAIATVAGIQSPEILAPPGTLAAPGTVAPPGPVAPPGTVAPFAERVGSVRPTARPNAPRGPLQAARSAARSP